MTLLIKNFNAKTLPKTGINILSSFYITAKWVLVIAMIVISWKWFSIPSGIFFIYFFLLLLLFHFGCFCDFTIPFNRSRSIAQFRSWILCTEYTLASSFIIQLHVNFVHHFHRNNCHVRFFLFGFGFDFKNKNKN